MNRCTLCPLFSSTPVCTRCTPKVDRARNLVLRGLLVPLARQFAERDRTEQVRIAAEQARIEREAIAARARASLAAIITANKPPINVSDVLPTPEPAGDGDTAVSGREGVKAEELLKTAKDRAVKTLSQISKQAVVRLLADPRWIRSARGMYTQEEKRQVAELYAAIGGTANMLGRARVRGRLKKNLAEFSEIWIQFADQPTLKPMAPEKAVEYFKALQPGISVDPKQFAQDQRRKGFTLAVTTEKAILVKVQNIIAGGLESGESTTSLVGQADAILKQAGIHPKNPQYVEMAIRTNIQDSLNVGQGDEMASPDMREFFPVFRYDGIEDGREGADHKPHFGKYYPSSVRFEVVRGKRKYNCRCTATYVNQFDWEDLQKGGARVESGYGATPVKPLPPATKPPKPQPVPVPATKAPDAPQPAIDPKQAVAVAFKRLDAKGYNQVAIADLQDATGLDTGTLHKAINDLRRDGLLTASQAERQVDKRTAATAINEGGSKLIYVGARQGMEADLAGVASGLPVEPPKVPLPHPEIDPTRQPITVQGGGLSSTKPSVPVTISPPKTMKEIKAIADQYAYMKPEEKQKVLDYFGVPPDEYGGRPLPLELEQALEAKVQERINEKPFAEVLKSLPQEEGRKQLLASAEALAQVREARRKEVSDAEVAAFSKAQDLERRASRTKSKKEHNAVMTEAAKLREEADRNLVLLSEMDRNEKKDGREQLAKVFGQAKTTPIAVQTHTPEVDQASATATEFIGKYVSPSGVPKQIATYEDPGNYREHYNPTKKAINAHAGTEPHVLVHELGHAIEYGDPEIQAAVQEFLKHRVGNERPKPMSDFPGSFAASEVGRDDDFAKAFNGDASKGRYAGKVYPDGATEILSLGVEQIYNDPVGFAKADPEYFNFVMGVLDGKVRRKRVPVGDGVIEAVPSTPMTLPTLPAASKILAAMDDFGYSPADVSSAGDIKQVAKAAGVSEDDVLQFLGKPAAKAPETGVVIKPAPLLKDAMKKAEIPFPVVLKQQNLSFYGALEKLTPEIEAKAAVYNAPVSSLIATQTRFEPAKALAIAATPQTAPKAGETQVSIVQALDGRYYIIEGHHRSAAALLRGDKTVVSRLYIEGPNGTLRPATAADLKAMPH